MIVLQIIKEMNSVKNGKNLLKTLALRRSYLTINLPGTSLKDSERKNVHMESSCIHQKTLVIGV